MQREIKKTKITVSEDYPCSITSEMYGANIGAVAFNIQYIAHRDPMMVVELFEMYEMAKGLKDQPELSNDDPDFVKANKYLKELLNADNN